MFIFREYPYSNEIHSNYSQIEVLSHISNNNMIGEDIYQYLLTK